MTGLSGVHHIGIVVQDIDASMAWYREHLGFECLYEYGWPGVKAAFIGRGALKLELFQNEEAAPMAVERRRPETNLQIGGNQSLRYRGHGLGRDRESLGNTGGKHRIAATRGA